MDCNLLESWWKDYGKLTVDKARTEYRKQGMPLGNVNNKVFNDLIESFLLEEQVRNGEIVKIVQINDLHIPHQDNKTLEIFYSFLKDYKPNKIVIAGDLLDFYELSSFDKDPKRKFSIQEEIDKCYEILKKLKTYCEEIHFIKGNHEDRLRRFLWKNPSLASIKVLELSKLLNLDTLDIEYHDFEYIFNGFRWTHGSIVRQESGASSKAEFLKYGSSMASGHTHRLGVYVKTDARGTIGAYEGGCLCDLHPEYIQGTPNWQQGFLTYTFYKDRFFCQVVPIIEHKFIYGDKLYK